MKMTRAFIAISMMAVLAASCSGEPTSYEPNNLSGNAIQFATNTLPVISTKAANDPEKLQDQKFQLNEPINVYLTKNGTNDLLLPHGESSVSVNYYKFTVGAAYTGTGSNANSQVLTAPNNYEFQYPGTEGVDVYALHPASDDANVDATTTSFSVKENQKNDADYTNSDLIAATIANQKKTDGTILLKFGHKLSKVVVKLKTDPTENLGLELTGATISFNGDKTVALTHTKQADGTTTLTLGDTSDPSSIVLGEYDKEKGTAGIVIPQTAPKNQKLITVKLSNGAAFSYTPVEDEVFEAEKEYTYTLTLKAELLTLVSVEIKNWEAVARTGDAVLD